MALDLVRRVNSVQVDQLRQTLEKEFEEVFKGLGSLPFEYDIKLKPDAKPVVHAGRNVPFSIQPKLKETLQELETHEVIARVDKPTAWVNSLVIVEKKYGTLRLCLDPADLNEFVMR